MLFSRLNEQKKYLSIKKSFHLESYPMFIITNGPGNQLQRQFLGYSFHILQVHTTECVYRHFALKTPKPINKSSSTLSGYSQKTQAQQQGYLTIPLREYFSSLLPGQWKFPGSEGKTNHRSLWESVKPPGHDSSQMGSAMGDVCIPSLELSHTNVQTELLRQLSLILAPECVQGVKGVNSQTDDVWLICRKC